MKKLMLAGIAFAAMSTVGVSMIAPAGAVEVRKYWWGEFTCLTTCPPIEKIGDRPPVVKGYVQNTAKECMYQGKLLAGCVTQMHYNPTSDGDSGQVFSRD